MTGCSSTDAANVVNIPYRSNLLQFTSYWTKESIHPKCQLVSTILTNCLLLLSDTFFHKIFWSILNTWLEILTTYYLKKKMPLYITLLLLWCYYAFKLFWTMNVKPSWLLFVVFVIKCLDQRPGQGQRPLNVNAIMGINELPYTLNAYLQWLKKKRWNKRPGKMEKHL